MWIRNFYKSLISPSTRRRLIRRRPLASRPSLEALEDRCLLSFSPTLDYGLDSVPGALGAADINGDR